MNKSQLLSVEVASRGGRGTNFFTCITMLRLVLIFLLLPVVFSFSQDLKPHITGQKNLSTEQGVPITIRLSDLIVVEEEVDEPDPGTENPSEPPPENGNDDGGTDPDPGNGGNTGQNGGGSDDSNDDGSNDSDDSNDGDQTDDHAGPGHGDHKPDDKGPKGEKDHKDPKPPKGKKGDKGHKGNGRSYPDGYTLEILAGDNYTFSEHTVTPGATFTGQLIVRVQVSNETYVSDPFDLKITVQPAPVTNKPPKITGQIPLSTSVDTPLAITLADLVVVDPDNEYPGDFSLTVAQGDHYTTSANTVTPASAFVGTLNVTVTVSDGTANSEPFDLKITVEEKPNIAPKIIGQMPVSVSMNQSVLISLAVLKVEDSDSKYPEDFTLEVLRGDGYTVDGANVSPEKDFTGTLSVGVRVSDGHSFSDRYNMTVTVIPLPNVKPVITGQRGLKVAEGESLEMSLNYLVVADPDNRYPQDFSLQLAEGKNYSLSGNRITPADGFTGVITVAVTVSDGMDSSEPFLFKIEVVSVGSLEITAQKSVTIPEDSSCTLTLADITVSDPNHVYPSGFTLEIGKGDNYEADNTTIRPHRDFFGNLSVPVKVRQGNRVSAAFSFLIVVLPVDDAPRIMNVEPDPLVVSGGGPYTVTSTLELVDVDDDNLLYAEVSFSGTYQPGKDELACESSGNIRAVFEADKGILYLLGQAPVAEYQQSLRSVAYVSTTSPDSSRGQQPRMISFRVSDGKLTGDEVTRPVIFQATPAFDIPSAFTPNNDMANDTWRISGYTDYDNANVNIRVYDKKGNLVFHQEGLDTEWDGQYNGHPLPADVYFYAIEMDRPTGKINYKGIVSILR